jgi:hypothetical protein
MPEFSGGFTLNFPAILHYTTFQMRRIFAVFRGGKMPSLEQEFFPAYMGVKKPCREREKSSPLRNVFFPP